MDVQPAEKHKISSSCPGRRLSIVVLKFFSLFPVSFRNQQFQNRYDSSCLVEPDIEIHDE